jgi:hypothetical protein
MLGAYRHRCGLKNAPSIPPGATTGAPAMSSPPYQARCRSLGDRPLAVVTAGRDAQVGWMPLQERMAALSTRSVRHVLPDATHASLTDDERDAAVPSRRS